jgi:hypothetical protein
VRVQYVLAGGDLSDPDNAVVPVEEVGGQAIRRVPLTPIVNPLVQQVQHEQLVRIVGQDELVLV